MGQHLLPEGAAPSTPSTGYVSVYAKADGLLYSKDDAGVETPLGGNVALGLTAGKAQQVDQTVAATIRAATTDFTGESIEGTLSDTGVAITAFHGVAGITYKRKCLGAGDITAGAGLTILQGGVTITTAVGDTFEVYMLTSTTCEVRNYVRATGSVGGRTKTIAVTRDLTAASGVVAITGFGFTPKSVNIKAFRSNSTNFSDGNDNGVEAMCIYRRGSDGEMTGTAAASVFAHIDASNYQAANVSSFGFDTVNLVWTKVGLPTGTQTLYITAKE